MKRRIGFLWAVMIFLLPTAFAQGGHDLAELAPPPEEYRTWDLPVIAQDDKFIIFVFSRGDNDALEIRDRQGAGSFRVTHLRYQGECFVGLSPEPGVLEWAKTTCHRFIQLEAMLRGAQRQARAGKT